MIGSSKNLLRAASSTTPIELAWTLRKVTAPLYGRYSVLDQDTSPRDVFLKPDGTKMYVLGDAGNDVNEYSLGTPWELSTASYIRNFSILSQEDLPTGFFFKPDGTKMYVIGTRGDDVNEYTLGTAWDISTASYVRNFSVSAQERTPQSVFFKPDGTKMYVSGFDGDDINEYTLSTAWDISTASYVQNLVVSAQDILPTGVFFKDDGTKMYVLGDIGDDVNEYTLSTAWDISTASYVQNFSIAAQSTSPQGFFFRDDGTRMYLISTAFPWAVYSYTLSTAWDISTASWDAPSDGYFSVSAQESSPSGIFFKPDGTKVYIIGVSGDDVNEYTLSTAWDISTASYVQNFSVATEESDPNGIFFKPDGTKMFVIGSTGDDVNEYTLSTAWDISTASYVQNFSVAAEEATPQGVFFKDDGTKMFVVGPISDAIWTYTLSSAWDISTASIPAYGKFSVIAEETTPQGIFFKPDGTKMFVIGSTGDDVNEYTLSTAWEISTASYVQNFSVAAEETTPQGVFFKDDGTKMFVIGSTGDDVNEYTLSTAWDISTASYAQNFNVSVQDTLPADLFFKPDGTKMYVLGDAGNDVSEYTLGTAWDISTASYVQNFVVSGQESTPQGLFFKPDGTKMFVVGQAGDDVNEYALSTAWDISTASYVQNFSVAAQDGAPNGLFFKDDGTRMYIVGASTDSAYSYTLSTAWDISTASWDFPANAYLSVSAQESAPSDLFFKPDGTKMFVVGISADNVNEYTLSTAWEISTASYVRNYNVSSQELNPGGVFFKDDGTEMYITGSGDRAIWAYSLV